MSNVKNETLDEAQQDPNEDANAERCDASPKQCDLKPSDLTDSEDPIGWDKDEEVLEAFQPETIKLVTSPEDGMPVPADEPTSFQPNLAPAFTRTNVVCVEDDSEYVEMWAVEFADEYKYDIRAQKPEEEKNREARRLTADIDGHDMVIVFRDERLGNGEMRERQRFAPAAVKEIHGRLYGILPRPREAVPVRPKRPRCKYYKRQCFANESAPDPKEHGHFDVHRNCTLRRSIGGAFLSVSDTAVYACDYRDPPDEESVKKYLDGPDKKRLDGPSPEKVPMFGLD